MNIAVVAIVLAIGAGAVVAVSTRESAAAAIGLAVALVAAALFADPMPSAAVLGVRIVAALLAAALIRWAGRGAARQFSPLGWPGEALLATAAAIAGMGVAVGLASVGLLGGGPDGIGGIGPDGGPAGPVPSGVAAVTTMALMIAAGCSLLAVAGPPLVHSRPGIRRAIGLVLATQAVLLIRIGVGGPSTDLEEVARAALLVTAAAAGAALTRATSVAALAARTTSADDVVETEPDADLEVEVGHKASRRRAAPP